MLTKELASARGEAGVSFCKRRSGRSLIRPDFSSPADIWKRQGKERTLSNGEMRSAKALGLMTLNRFPWMG